MAYLYGTMDNDKITMCVEWGYSQDYDANTSRIWAKLMFWKPGEYNTAEYCNCGLSINGNEKSVEGYWMNLQNGTTYTPVEHAVTVPHNPDGTLTCSISAYCWPINGHLNTTITLPQIPRQATLSSAPNFTDEQNPTITYSNPVGDYAGMTLLQACIASNDGQTIYVPYRDISKTGTSYTFNLTTDERNALRAATPNSNTMAVKFYIKCVLNGDTLYSSLAKTLTIVNANPLLNSVSVKDVNVETTYLTGDSSKIIRYFSDVSASFVPQAQKYATLKRYTITNGSTIMENTKDYVFNDVENRSFTFYASDSRGNASNKQVNMTMIEYTKLSCSIKAVAPTTDGDGSITITGNYWVGNFGAYSNVLILHYRHKEGDGNYGEWQAITATPTLNGNKFSIKVNLTGLDYRATHTFQARAADRLMTVDSNQHKVRTTPVFDWGEEDFNFNVPVIYTKVPTTSAETAITYNLSGAAKALSTTYSLAGQITPHTNWTVNGGNCNLIGCNLRCYFNATRSSATGTGNITNENVVHFSYNHGGKIKALYANGFTTASSGPIATFTIANQSVDDTTLSFDVVLAAVDTASTNFNAYFCLPCSLNLDAY